MTHSKEGYFRSLSNNQASPQYRVCRCKEAGGQDHRFGTAQTNIEDRPIVPRLASPPPIAANCLEATLPPVFRMVRSGPTAKSCCGAVVVDTFELLDTRRLCALSVDFHMLKYCTQCQSMHPSIAIDLGILTRCEALALQNT